jgi:hypothetical protein
MLDLSGMNALEDLGRLLLLVINGKGLLLILLTLSLRRHCLLGWGNLHINVHRFEKACGGFGPGRCRDLKLDVL